MSKQYLYEQRVVSDIVGRQPAWLIRSGIGLLLFVILVLLGFAGFIQYPDSLQAKIAIKSNVAPTELVTKRAGYIYSLNVKTGTLVEKNTVLMLLDSGSDPESVLLLERAIRDRELEQIGPEEFPRLGELQNRFDQLQQNLLQKQLLVSNNQVAQKRTHVEEQKAKFLALDNEYSNKLDTANALIELEQKRLKAHNRLKLVGDTSENAIISIKQRLLELRAQIDNIRIARTENDLRVTSIVQDLADYTLSYDSQLASLDNSIELSRLALLNDISQWKQDYLVIAPEAGVVTFNQHWSPNQFVSMGESMFTLSPQEFEVHGQMKLASRGAGRVKPDQPVYIELDSFPATQFGQLKGKVKSVSLVPDKNGYLVNIVLPSQLKTTFDYALNQAPYYSGNAKIILHKRTLLSRFFDSVSYMIKKDGQE